MLFRSLVTLPYTAKQEKEILMTYTLPDLGYAFDALEPHIDARTMEIHHDKHHAGYVANLNAAVEGTELGEKTVCDLIAALDDVPENIRSAVRNNGGGHRSEERRGGQECSSRWSPYHKKKNKKRRLTGMFSVVTT